GPACLQRPPDGRGRSRREALPATSRILPQGPQPGVVRDRPAPAPRHGGRRAERAARGARGDAAVRLLGSRPLAGGGPDLRHQGDARSGRGRSPRNGGERRMTFVHDGPGFVALLTQVSAGTGMAGALVEKDCWIAHSLWALHEAELAIWFK